MTTIAKRQNGNAPQTFGKMVDHLFQQTLQDFFTDPLWTGSSALQQSRVPINVRETPDSFQIDVVAPGCRKEDFNVAIKENMLTVGLDRKEENAETDETRGWVRNEFIQQSFTRSFTLDETVDANRISCEYKDGILRINLPKNEKAQIQSRQIDVH
ncbi:MAG: Hsp20/alpha crystallin family protein [Chitinophagaceae bacterium]|nr:Hsp20/alpha crystallin family protein [Chitinophagaceae bacterium]